MSNVVAECPERPVAVRSQVRLLAMQFREIVGLGYKFNFVDARGNYRSSPHPAGGIAQCACFAKLHLSSNEIINLSLGYVTPVHRLLVDDGQDHVFTRAILLDHNGDELLTQEDNDPKPIKSNQFFQAVWAVDVSVPVKSLEDQAPVSEWSPDYSSCPLWAIILGLGQVSKGGLWFKGDQMGGGKMALKSLQTSMAVDGVFRDIRF